MRVSLVPSTNPGDYAFAHQLRVRFAETDAMGVVHHGAYLPYLEEARVAYLRAIGHPYDTVRSAGVDFAVIELAISYLAPLRFDDVADVYLMMGAASRATFQIAYLVMSDSPRATAVTVHGCVDAAGRPVRMPGWLRTSLAR